jgi:hypothetical protein
MAKDADKWVDAITRLTKLTQEGKLEWSTVSPGGVLVNDDSQQVESAFTAYHKDKRLRLYKKRFKVEDPNPLLTGMMVAPFAPKYPYWAAQIYLELIDDYGQSLWTFPEVSALRDLLTSVKYQASGVKDLLDDLLKEEGMGLPDNS